MRRIGSRPKIEVQMRLVALAAELSPKDSTDMWQALGNEDPQRLIDANYAQFLAYAKRFIPAA
jgi:hypothetical protein